ncbi:MAG: aminotransferase arnB [Candidatus Scalindua rubra]|uniref:Aminotransferase arnB n=1 Tax=Candidatus Scalindua rubra TaxID=1872076 RepID=A0A1E3X931_9BACT|nr:MAG: aminotransferase arnB [Candidatus Scalindua rubra]
MSKKIVIPHSKPSLDENEVISVSNVIRSGRIVQGKVVEKLERKMAKYIGARGAVATSTGTSALHLALLAIGIKKGDYIAIPNFVCSALLNVVKYVGALPILADADRKTYNIDIYDLKKRINKSTKAIIVPHQFGLPADIDEVMSLGIPVIEDCAQAIGAIYKGKKVGSFGRLSCFSFYATKVMATGEGGMVVSDSENLLKKIRDLREYDNRKNYLIRYNYKMTDIQAAMGISQLKKLNSLLLKRVNIAKRYFSELQGFCNLPSISYKDRRHIFFRFLIQVRGSVSKALEFLSERGVTCMRPVYKPLHKYLHIHGFPNSDAIWNRTISIPIYPSLTDKEICIILNVLKQYLKRKI